MPPNKQKNRTTAPDKPTKGSVEGAHRGTSTGAMAGRQRGRDAIEPSELSKEANPNPKDGEPHMRTTTPQMEGSVEGAPKQRAWQVLQDTRARQTAERI